MATKLTAFTPMQDEIKKLKEERDLLIDALKPLANLDLEGAHPLADAVYSRNKSKITFQDVIKAKELLINITK